MAVYSTKERRQDLQVSTIRRIGRNAGREKRPSASWENLLDRHRPVLCEELSGQRSHIAKLE
jgi:histone H3/H4